MDGRTAGRTVERIAHRLLAATETIEHRTFDRQAERWADPVDAMRRAVEDDGTARPQQTATRVARLAVPALDRAGALLVECVRLTGVEAVESVRAELRIIEQFALGAETGIAVTSATEVASVSDSFVEAVEALWVDEDGPAILARFRADVEAQLRAAPDDEPVERTADRIVRDVSVNLPGRSGRGVWWSALTAVHAVTRARSVGGMNVLREATMMLARDRIAGALG